MNLSEPVRLFIIFLSSVYVLFGLAAPILAGMGVDQHYFAYRLARSICVQRPSKCFWIGNYHTGICGKCLGLYAGMLLAAFMPKTIRNSYLYQLIEKIGMVSLVILLVHSIARSIWGGIDLDTTNNFILD